VTKQRKAPARAPRIDARTGRDPAGDGGPDLYARARALERKLEAIDPRLADELAEALADVMKAGLLLHGELALERTARAVTTAGAHRRQRARAALPCPASEPEAGPSNRAPSSPQDALNG
jgi:hypothetical protein